MGKLASKSKIMKPFLNNFLNIFHFRRQTAFFAVLGAVFVLGILIFPYHSAHAGVVSGMVGEALGWIFGLIFAVLGWVLSSLIGALVSIAEYNKIISQDTVIKTWGVVRDIVNMFFIFAILLIAFSTILRIHQYEAKQLLPKLVLYAILVNFSLTICGLFIDIAQVFTLTFVNAFKDGAINNFTTVTKLFTYSDLKDVDISTFTVMGGYMLALVLLVVTLVTIGAMFLILLVRIAYLWILSILSPFAFVLPIIPGGQGYASQWWTMFSKQVITGPLLAFFIWLSLTILSQTGNIGNEILNSSGQSTIAGAIGSGGTATATGLPTTTQADFLINYVIAIAMMFIGLMLTSQMGGAAGKIAGGASNWMQRSGTGFITGRLGPTPMRWARERYQSYRGQRESIRKESAQRFGQGVSAMQDKAIGGRLKQLAGLPLTYATHLGKWGAQKVTYEAGKNAPSGSRRERWTNKAFNAADKIKMKWKPGELTRERAMERVNIYEDNKKSKDQETYQKAGRLSSKDEAELRARLSKPNISRREEAAITETLGSKYALKRSDLGAINRTRSFLGDTMVRQKFDDLLKKTDIEVAFLSKIYRKTNAETGKEEINIDRFRSDLNQSKIDSSAITNKMFDEMDDQLIGKGAKKGAFIEQWVDEMGSSKEIKNSIGSLSRNVIDEQMKYVATSHLTEEKALAVGEGSNHWENIFNRKNNKFDEEMAGRFFSNAQNKDLFVKGHGAKFGNKELVEFLHDEWQKYEFTGSQWAKMYEDTQARESIQKIAPDLLSKINSDIESYNTTEKYGYGKTRLRNTIVQFAKSDTYDYKYTDERGEEKKEKMEIYGLHHENPEVRKAAKAAFIESVKQGRLMAEKLENANVWKDEAEETGSNEELLEVLAAFNSDGIAKLSIESRKRGEKVIEYMIKNYKKYQGTVDRLLSNNALVHMMSETTKEGPTLRELYDEEKAKFNEKGETEKKEKEARKEEKERKKKEEESKPPPTSGGSSPFGV